MRLLLDENLSPALGGRLTSDSITCVHVSRVGLLAADDADIWSFAAREGYTIVTKDKDFEQRALLFGPPPQVVRLAIGNRSLAATETIVRSYIDTIRAFGGRPEDALLLINIDNKPG